MGLASGFKRLFTWWNGRTLGTQLWTWRTGIEVGRDAQGNIFYTNKANTRRWVIFDGEVEATKVSPEWHGWLHHTWDEPPTELSLLHQPWEKPHSENLTGTAAAYAPAGSIRKVVPKTPQDYEAWSPE